MSNPKEEDETWGLLADALGSLDQLEDDVSVDVKEKFQFRSKPKAELTKTPLQKSKQYLAFSEAAEELVDGHIDKPTYLARVEPLVQQQRAILQTLSDPQVEKRYAGLSEDENRLYKEIRGCFTRLIHGGERMLAYGQSDELDDVEQGLKLLDEAYLALDRAQDEVIALKERL